MIAPNVSPHPMSERFKLGMRRHASNVCVLATVHEGRRHGMTATAISSVCAEPPTLLVCVNRATTFHGPVRSAARFSVNVLSEEHVEIARRFGGKGPRDARFADAPWRDCGGWTYLENACASFLVTTVAAVEHHSHAVLLGQVEDVIFGAGDPPPLIYHDGQFAACAPLRAA